MERAEAKAGAAAAFPLGLQLQFLQEHSIPC